MKKIGIFLPGRGAGGRVRTWYKMRALAFFRCAALLLLTGLVAAPGRAEEAWSPAVNGLKARLSFALLPKEIGAPNLNEENTRDVLLQLQRVSDRDGLIQLDFAHAKLVLHVGLAPGKELKPLENDEVVSGWPPLLLPLQGFLSFSLGMEVGKDASSSVDGLNFMMLGTIWKLPRVADEKYFLWATLECEPRTNSDIPFWSGTLILPPVEIPRLSTK